MSPLSPLSPLTRLLAGMCLLAACSAAAQAPPRGLPIETVTFEGEGPRETERLGVLSGLVKGRALDESAVRTALRNLHATRLFADLTLLSAEENGRAHVLVKLVPAPRIETLTLPPKVPSRSRLRVASGLAAGDPWSPSKANEAAKGVLRALAEMGYFEATAGARVSGGSNDRLVRVDLGIVPGPKALQGAPRFTGAIAPFTSDELAAALRLGVGRPYREGRAEREVERLLEHLRGKGHARAEVRFEREEYVAEKREAVPVYAVFAGPRVVLTVRGEKESLVKGHAESPWTKGEPPDEDSLEKLREDVRQTLQERGYAKAQISTSYETAPGEERVTFDIQKGDRYSVAHVGISGVSSFREKDLKAALETTRRGFLTTGRLVERTTAGDRATLSARYRSEGFADVQAGAPIVTDARRPFTLGVTFPIQEGPRTVVALVELTGVTALPLDEVLGKLAIRPLVPFDPSAVESDTALLRSLYADSGYLEARVEAEVIPLAIPVPVTPAMEVHYRVVEGEPSILGATILRGNTRTRHSLVEEAYAHKEGQPFSLATLVETQRNVSRLGVFSRVEVTTLPPDPETRARAVVITVTEASPWNVVYSLGGEYAPSAAKRFSPRLSLGLSYANLFGRAMAAGIEGRYSSLDSRILATLRERSFFGTGVPLGLTGYAAKQVRKTYDVRRAGFFLESERSFGPILKTTLRYQYEVVKPSADPGLGADQRQNTAKRVSSVGPGLLWDLRDDPIYPTRGGNISLDAKLAFPFLSADAAFFKIYLQAAGYKSIGAAGGAVLAVSIRTGLIAPYGDCDVVANPACAPNLEVPVSERLFAGGRSSHRAFAPDALGIPGQTLVSNGEDLVGSGGNGLVVGNVELRQPIAGDLGVALFFDTGNVWASFKDVKLSNLRHGAGLGLFYRSPVGPVRVEYGWKLDRKTGESAGEFAFSIGYPF
ncbi:MAG: BamA/TamA family outer membrane protein [Acidobacteria bacterium]|nr:BamA/TamA family outer membrane protein [Acidobacteriota bacterium]